MLPAEVDRALVGSPPEAASALLETPEGQWFERKSGRVSARDLAVPLVALANAEGGVIVVGLHNGIVEGVLPARQNALRQAALDYTEPPVRVSATTLLVPRDPGQEEATLLILRVQPGDRVHALTSGVVYLRVGDESRKLNAQQVRELEFDRGPGLYEGTPTNLRVEDLDQSQLAAYTRAIGSSSPSAMLFARDLVDRKGALTVAACLLFDDRPQRDYPAAHIRVLRYGATDRRTGAELTLEDGADVRIDGSLPHQISDAARRIEGWAPKWRQLGPSGLFEPTHRIPRAAWLEGLVNAVVHRSYSLMGDHIRVEIFPNRIEISSPGRFPAVSDLTDPLKITRYARNPRIARVCADLGIAQELGEGIQRMFAEMRRRGLADPLYEQFSGSVKLTLLAVDAVPGTVLSRLTPSARRILDQMRLFPEPLGTGQLADMAGVTRMTATRALNALVDEGLIEWSGTSKKDPRAVWRLA